MARLFRYLPLHSTEWGWVIAENPTEAVRMAQDYLAFEDDEWEAPPVRLVEYPLTAQVLPAYWADEASRRTDQPAVHS